MRPGLTSGVVKSPGRQSDSLSKLMQLLEPGRTEIVAEKVAPPAAFGLKELVHPDLNQGF
jgi:hypothetical protein